MDEHMQRIATVLLLAFLLLGCTLLQPAEKPPETGENETITTLETPMITTVEINESEGEFPLPA